MNARGRLADGAQQVEVDAERGIVLRERDISELAQAKGATTAGLEIVLRELGGTADDLDVFYLAGGFGRHLDLAAAKRLGLIPEIPDARIRQIGNAAIEGAARALCSLEARRELDAFVRGIRHVPLESDPDFFDRFALGCLLGPARP
jgi:uncharacterized 2Fe-2S/4Fe-4S cluster protein (DUF4445 family)